MALGLGQFAGQFSRPDEPLGGINDYASLVGIDESNPMVSGPAHGGFEADPTMQGPGLVHVSTGANNTPLGRAPHWSNLLDVKNGPMFWLLAVIVLYMGLVSVQVGARVGRR